MAERAASRRLRIVIAVLIGASSVLGAVVAWRATIAESRATTAERKALADEVARERTRVEIFDFLNDVHFFFIRGQAHQERATELRRRADEVSADQRALLLADAEAYESAAESDFNAVSQDAIDADGMLDIDKAFEIEWDAARRAQDLDPEPDFHAADINLTKAERLVGLSAMLIAGVFFLTLAEFAKSVAYRLYFLGGTVAIVVAASLVIAVEIG
jgi:hypothetical protein